MSKRLAVEAVGEKEPVHCHVTEELREANDRRIGFSSTSDHGDIWALDFRQLYAFQQMLELEVGSRHGIADKDPVGAPHGIRLEKLTSAFELCPGPAICVLFLLIILNNLGHFRQIWQNQLCSCAAIKGKRITRNPASVVGSKKSNHSRHILGSS
jgi:hypothetical protein